MMNTLKFQIKECGFWVLYKCQVLDAGLEIMSCFVQSVVT